MSDYVVKYLYSALLIIFVGFSEGMRTDFQTSALPLSYLAKNITTCELSTVGIIAGALVVDKLR